MFKILFVCTGNTCRSSMAEALAKQIIADRQLQDELMVSSAGISAMKGMPAAEQAVEVMSRQGIDLTGHRASMVNKNILTETDLVLTMTDSHKAALRGQVPEDKLYILGEYAGEPGNISDPIGGPVEVYQQCAQQLARLIAKAIERALA
ncbi:low molecular weight protein arginine phosphatase [Metallumcola ferriviriculae]|uniref:Low molecular weight protein arginine phosphatase n=1 Tax=Metallumcola ferriviriculae TaxID=3039180 RepID=A0AAU0UKJ2_9FIRM|nr:low molecular weight protein arginine phosphatase [Desulfitibacteraceae bacterium MK1]